MNVVLQEENILVLRMSRGEEFVTALKSFCREKNIRGGYFSAIGAASRALLSWYDVATKKYTDRAAMGPLEIVSLSGTVATKGEEMIIHAHGCFSDTEFAVHGGHVKECAIGATCEIVFTELSAPLARVPDKETGLNLLG